MGLVRRPINPKAKDVVIGLGKPKRFRKSPWECKKEERIKWAKDTQIMKRAEDAQRMKWAGEAQDVE